MLFRFQSLHRSSLLQDMRDQSPGHFNLAKEEVGTESYTPETLPEVGGRDVSTAHSIDLAGARPPRQFL